MALLGKVKARAQSLVVFEISTSSVSASLGVRDTQSTRLLWSKRLEYSFERTDEYAHYTKSMYAALLEVGMALLNDGVRIAQRDSAFSIRHAHVHCVLSPPWFFAAVRSASRTYEKRRQVTHSMQDELKGQLCNEVLQQPEYTAWTAVSGIGEIMEQYGDANKAVWVGELGWNATPPEWSGQPSIWGTSVDEETKARYIVEALDRSQREWPWMGARNLWFLRWGGPPPDADDPTQFFALVAYDFTPLPAYQAVRDWAADSPPLGVGYHDLGTTTEPQYTFQGTRLALVLPAGTDPYAPEVYA